MVRLVSAKGRSRFIYLWIVPYEHSLIGNKYNILSLSLEGSLSSEEPKDSHRMGIFHYQALLFDLNAIPSFGGDKDAIPDYITCTALAIRANHKVYMEEDKDILFKKYSQRNAKCLAKMAGFFGATKKE